MKRKTVFLFLATLAVLLISGGVLVYFIKYDPPLNVSPITITDGTPVPTPPPGPNTVNNNSVETMSSADNTLPANWSRQSWGENTPVFSYLDGEGRSGSRALKVQMDAYTSGDAKWVFDHIDVTPGQSYYYSDWYRSDIVTSIVVEFIKTDGSYFYLGLRSAPASETWAHYNETFQIPPDVKSMAVLHLIDQLGWLTLDDFSLIQYTPQPLDRPLVSITIDDGWEDDVITVLPVLDQYNYKATFFFATTFLENTPPTGPINVSGPAAIDAIYNAGHEIGGHTVTHPDLTTVSPTELEYELTDSKEYLESLVGPGVVKNFAAPYGAYNDATIAAVEDLYKSHRTTDEGFNTLENFDINRIKVQNMEKTTTLAEFQSWVDQAVQDNSWLVLVYHRVAEDNLTQYDTPLEDFVPQMEIIKNSGINVVTYDEGLDEVMAQLP